MKTDKIRVNITVDRDLLRKAKSRLDLFGGKLSTLFNAYLRDFVSSMDKEFSSEQRQLMQKVLELETRLKRLETTRETT